MLKILCRFQNNDCSALRSSEKKLKLAKDNPTCFTRGLCSLPHAAEKEMIYLDGTSKVSVSR